MEFAFSPEQGALRASVRDVLARESPIALVRDRVDAHVRAPSDAWARIVALGWTATLVPSDEGGLGLGIVDAALIMEEIGRALYDGPFLSSAVLATLGARALGAHDLIAGLVHNERGTIALDELGHGDPTERVQVTATADGATGHYRLNGAKPLVIDGDTCDWVIVAARATPDLAIRSFLVRNPPAVPTPTLDVTRRFATLEFDATPATAVGPAGDHHEIWRRIADDGAVALAAELLGVADAANALALDYAQAREVFGKPLSKFQVTRHKAVDLLREIELARVGVHFAAWASDTDAPERADAAAMAKAYAAEAANHVSAECVQIHGGVGYTWECDAHLYLRRAKVDDLLLGNQGWQRQRLADQYFARL